MGRSFHEYPPERGIFDRQAEDTKMKKHPSISAVLFCFIVLPLLVETTWGAVSDHWTEHGVAFGLDRFVAVGEGGNIFTSPDGSDWTQRTSGTTVSLHNIAYGTGAFAAVGDDGTILVSYNGVDWSPHTSGTSFDLLAVKAGQGTFVAGGANGILLQSDKAQYFLPLILK